MSVCTSLVLHLLLDCQRDPQMRLLDKLEDYLCRGLLITFVTLLFIQIILREIFNFGLPWIEELSRFAFVWFAFLGASYAAKLNAHNRVELHLKLLPDALYKSTIFLVDMVWVIFNGLIVYKASQVIAELTEWPYLTPALGWSLAHVYYIFPLAFTLMSLRILQVQYNRIFKNIEPIDADQQQVKESVSVALGSGETQK